MSVFQRPAPQPRPRINHKTRQLGIRKTVMDSRPAQKAAYTPTISNVEVKRLQNEMGVPRSDDTKETILGRLITVHTCVAKLQDPSSRCDKCKERIPRVDAQLKVDCGGYKWLESRKSDGTIYPLRAIVKLDTPIPEQRILVHACLLKRSRCYCNHYVPLSHATALIGSGQATWMPVERNGVKYSMHSSIVLSVSEIRKMEAEVKKQKLLNADVVQRFRNAAQHETSSVFADEDLLSAMKGEYHFAGELAHLNDLFDGDGICLGRALKASAPTLADLFLRCIGWYWNRLIPTLSRYTFLGGSRSNESILITGGYDSISDGDLDLIASYSTAGDPYDEDDTEHSPASAYHATHSQGRRVQPEGPPPDGEDTPVAIEKLPEEDAEPEEEGISAS
jgi:hypothetical protein